jgi:excisionase family DNA binding protein
VAFPEGSQDSGYVGGMNEWITRTQLADRLGLSTRTLADWATRGTGPRRYRFGKHVRYRLTDVKDWENSQLVDAE